MKTLDLVLKAKWYDMISIGEKKEEYREIKPYWIKRLYTYKVNNGYRIISSYYLPKETSISCLTGTSIEDTIKFDRVRFRRGYTSKTMLFKLNDISIGTGKPEWGAPENKVFILKIGERIE